MGCSSSSTGHSGSKDARVLMIGLNKAGKTQILYRLKLNEQVTTIPTIGFNVETVPGPKGFQLTIWDVGGDDRLRPLWRHYYNNCDVIVYVVDSANQERLNEAKGVLFGVIGEQDVRGVPILVLANKTDVSGALTPSDVQDKLHMKAIIDRACGLVPVCGLTGEGLDKATAEIVRLITETRKTKNSVPKNKTV